MNDRSRARLLLVELILDLVIFALCAAVCVALLVRARSMSRESAELTQAVYLAQTAAETWRSHGDGADRTVDGYQVQHTRTSGGTSVQTGRVRISRDGRLVYELEVSLP